MKQTFLFLALLFSCPAAQGQTGRPQGSFTVSIEPNLLLASRSYSRDRPSVPLYLREDRTVGAGVNFGYQVEAPRWYAGGTLQLADVRNAVVIDYAGSGFSDKYRYRPASDKYSFSYGPLIGLEAQAGYRKNVGRATLLIGGGLHLHLFPVRKTERGVLLDPRESSQAAFALVYYEYIDKYPLIAPGADLHLQLAFRIGRRRPFIGLHYSYAPSPIEGSYQTFRGERYGNNGRFKLQQSFAGLQLGLMLGK